MLNIMSVVTNTLLHMQSVKLLKLNGADLPDNTPESFPEAYEAINRILHASKPTHEQALALIDYINRTDGNICDCDLIDLRNWLKSWHNVKAL